MTKLDSNYLPNEVVVMSVESAKTAGFTCVHGKVYPINPSANMNIQLPTPSVDANITIKDISSNLENVVVTILRAGTEKIDGVQANVIMNSDTQTVRLISDGVDWYLI